MMNSASPAKAKHGQKKLRRLKKPKHAAPFHPGGQWQASLVLYQFGHKLHAGDNTQHTTYPYLSRATSLVGADQQPDEDVCREVAAARTRLPGTGSTKEPELKALVLSLTLTTALTATKPRNLQLKTHQATSPPPPSHFCTHRR